MGGGGTDSLVVKAMAGKGRREIGTGARLHHLPCPP